MTNPQFVLGFPYEFKNICLIYPPLVKTIVCNKNYSIYVKLLTLSQEEIEDEYNAENKDLSQMLTPFEYLLNGAYNNLQFQSVLKDAFAFFIHEPVLFLFEQKEILIGDMEGVKSANELRMLKEEDFFEFQNLIRESIGTKSVQPPNPNEDPRIKAIKAKARYRDKIKAKQGKNLNLSSILASICCMNIGITPLNVGELSYAAIPLLMSTYQAKEKYQLDIESLLAGADSKKVKPEYWIRNIEEN